MIAKWPFEKSPRPVQLAALKAGLGKEGFAYFMRMRMGKTGTLLADYELTRRAGKVDYLIWVSLNSLKGQMNGAAVDEWKLSVPVHVFESGKKDAYIAFCKANKQGVVILNIESLSNFHSYGLHKAYDASRAMLCIDQSTIIKNKDALCTKAALKLAPLHKYTRIMAGKPKANSNLDLWAQLKFIGFNKFSYYGFRNTFVQLGGWMGKVPISDQNDDYLRSIIASVSFIGGDQYLKEVALKEYLPMLKVEFTKLQAKLYKAMEHDMLIEIGEQSITAPIALTRNLRLQQIASGFSTTDDKKLVEIMPPAKNPRLIATYNKVRDECDNKVIIACRFLSSIHWLKEALAEFNPIMIVGGMTPRDIEEGKARFNTDTTTRVCIGQLNALKFGHTLCGPEEMPCDTLIFYENDYSLITRAEVEARPEKLGRKIGVSVIDFHNSAIDADMIKALRKKEDAATVLMGYARKYGVLAA